MGRFYTVYQYHLSPLDELNWKKRGIVRSSDTLEVKSNTKALIIGLGGMGVSTVRQLQKKLTKQLSKYPSGNIELLYLDASAAELFENGTSDTSQIHDTLLLYNEKISEMTGMSESELPDAARSILPPKGASFIPKLCGDGANQMRLAGRIAIMENSLYEALTDILNEKIRNLRVPDNNAYRPKR